MPCSGDAEALPRANHKQGWARLFGVALASWNHGYLLETLVRNTGSGGTSSLPLHAKKPVRAPKLSSYELDPQPTDPTPVPTKVDVLEFVGWGFNQEFASLRIL